MKMQTALVVAVAALVALPAFGQDFRWQGRVGAGDAVEIKGVNGSIDARPASSAEVEVVAHKTARRSDTGQVEIKVVEHSGGVTICAVYPSRREPNECKPGSAGRLNSHDNDVQVDFTVHVPADVRFVGRTVNGGVEAEDLGADVEVSTVNGSVKASGNGVVRAESVNGSVTAAMGRADWTGEVELKTVNGAVTVDLPATANASVEASTVNGNIETDFPLTVRGKLGARRLSGTIGNGGRQLSLVTVNGSIRLRQGR